LTTPGLRKLEETISRWEKAQTHFEAAFGDKNAEFVRSCLEEISSAEFVRLLEGAA
jgi:hypothetical protein